MSINIEDYFSIYGLCETTIYRKDALNLAKTAKKQILLPCLKSCFGIILGGFGFFSVHWLLTTAAARPGSLPQKLRRSPPTEP